MISGQVGRFVWRDQTGPLITPADPACPPVVDVYIVLQGGELKQQWIGARPVLPYAAETSPASLEAWYAFRGARDVHVEYSSEEDMESYLDEVIRNALHRKFNVWRHGDGRSQVNLRNLLRMLYLRHLVFAATVASGHAYDGYTYWREDNFFFAPLAENLFPSDEDRPLVVVDANCDDWNKKREDYSPAYPNKIYTTNLAGAKVLFGATMEDFVADMSEIAGISHTNSEHLLKIILDRGSNVTAREFHRADVRYVAGHEGLCVPGLYARCSPDLETELNASPDLQICPNNQTSAVTSLPPRRGSGPVGPP